VSSSRPSSTLKSIRKTDGAFDNVDTILKKLQPIQFGFVEFDDQFAEKQLVYGITVNRTDNKRITVFFRSSVIDSRDWPTNFNAFFQTLDTPNEIKGVFKIKGLIAL
jgi:hypothetical protein